MITFVFLPNFMTEKQKHTTEFETELNKFVDELKKYISTDTGEWTVKGFIDVYKNIYTISSDTKISISQCNR